MKRKIFLLILALLLIPSTFIFSACGADKTVEIRVVGDYVQWSYVGENTWKDIAEVESIKSSLGNTFKGDKGDAGVDGKQVEFDVQDGYIKWHYVGSNSWTNLISLDEIKADANSNQEIENFDNENSQGLAFYPLDDGTYGVGAGNATQLSNIVIPETYNGKKITKIVESGFEGCSKLKSIVISNNIKVIPSYAFSGCSKLEEVILPNSLEIIEHYAFYECSIKSITIPSSVKSIGTRNFQNISSVVFENPNGWEINDSPTIVLSSEELSDPTTAATYFEGIYQYRSWTRVE